MLVDCVGDVYVVEYVGWFGGIVWVEVVVDWWGVD